MSDTTEQRKNNPAYRPIILGILWLLLGVIIFTAQIASAPKIEVTWKTASEFDTAGFNIFRSEKPDQDFQQINNSLIHSEADTTSGAEYSYVDYEVDNGKIYYYRLEDVEFNGATNLHEVVSGESVRFDPWALVLAGICILVGAAFLINGLIN
ncbi:MAG: hypothetical protein ACK2T3_05130, partial [Candidatus Promineifilaceae bacterium]